MPKKFLESHLILGLIFIEVHVCSASIFVFFAFEFFLFKSQLVIPTFPFLQTTFDMYGFTFVRLNIYWNLLKIKQTHFKFVV